MLKRLVIVALLLWPTVSLADQLSPAGDVPGASTSLGGVLQPAGQTSPLSADNSQGSQLQAAGGNSLQLSPGTNQLAVLAGEADGAPHETSHSSSTAWLWVGLVVAAAVVSAAWSIGQVRRSS